MLVYGECECFVMQMLYVCVLCASCGSSQCCVLHDLQFVNAGRGCNRRPSRAGYPSWHQLHVYCISSSSVYSPFSDRVGLPSHLHIKSIIYFKILISAIIFSLFE